MWEEGKVGKKKGSVVGEGGGRGRGRREVGGREDENGGKEEGEMEGWVGEKGGRKRRVKSGGSVQQPSQLKRGDEDKRASRALGTTKDIKMEITFMYAVG